MYRVYGVDGYPASYPDYDRMEKVLEDLLPLGILFSVKDMTTGDIVYSNFLSI